MIPNIILLFFILMDGLPPLTPTQKPKILQAYNERTLNFINNNNNLIIINDQNNFIQSPLVYIQSLNINSPGYSNLNLSPNYNFTYSLINSNHYLNINSVIHPYSFLNEDMRKNELQSLTPKRSNFNQQNKPNKKSRILFPEIKSFTITSPTALDMPNAVIAQIDLINNENDIIIESENHSIIRLPSHHSEYKVKNNFKI